TLKAALTTAGLNDGDVIQIEPNSSPGGLLNAYVPAVKYLTIQGDPAFDVKSIPLFSVDDIVNIGSAQQGFTLKNVQVWTDGGTLEFFTDCTITGARIKTYNDAGTAIRLDGTSAAVIRNSYFEESSTVSKQTTLMLVEPASGSHNRITDNQFV